ncbi:hypothetical protein [Cyclobacterium xiamenense]|uniref:hypothetical protein n=1 Tax=Cyclobacterium xiamenense TaxID=1297121 RepID=UPI00115FB050|nr:hypothetical protein [Cyclobacterium xiamenense]
MSPTTSFAGYIFKLRNSKDRFLVNLSKTYLVFIGFSYLERGDLCGSPLFTFARHSPTEVGGDYQKLARGNHK